MTASAPPNARPAAVAPSRRPRWTPVDCPDLPDDLILFDGVCVLCEGWVRFVIARDHAGRFRFTSIQSPYGRALAERLGIDPDRPESNAVIVAGRAWFKSDSALRALELLPGWRPIRYLHWLPRGLRDWCYDRIARNRYRLFGQRTSCLVPDAALTRRFLAEIPDDNGVDKISGPEQRPRPSAFAEPAV